MSPPLTLSLARVARAWRDASQPAATFEAAGEAFREQVGFGLYTVTHILPGGREVERLHSTNPAAYAVGGRKPVIPNAFREQMFGTGQPFLGRTPVDFSPYFPDHAFIVSLGLGCVINLPLFFAGAPLGSVNLLDREGAYDTEHVEPALAIAQMVVPALIARGLAVAEPTSVEGESP
ncbi:GAF domain-containing protein [Alsobacter sp. R-9]